ncbi:type IV pilin protein [Deinococcus sp. 12RED42]|uniref:type IV pilin protein n=1 Tax=Deinococcus sp. 12RED42 TaxID=2745872 RepID=UPI001E507AB6|nr:type II secretion system protein [Deinococcus sp. 12RED42]MCD0164811.1 type II secretion system protein [Deinococcus sp. 12RED42]
MKNNTQGFTLIELLIVIAIIGILAAVLIPNLLGAQKRAYDTAAQACAKSIQTAQATAQIDNQTYAANQTAMLSLEGVSARCSDTNIAISSYNGGVSTYTFTIKDNRGANTYTVTPINISKN